MSVVMVSEAAAPDPVAAFVRPMLGRPAWGVKQGYGSFLTFEFGEPELKAAKLLSGAGGLRSTTYLRGQWHLWIYCCRWRALQQGRQLAWSEDEDFLIGSAASFLEGQKLRAVTVDPILGRSTFTFDRGGSLETWPYGEDPADEQWIILTAEEAFAFRADGFYHRDPGDTPPAQVRWIPLR
jgi:hypothetical protein